MNHISLLMLSIFLPLQVLYTVNLAVAGEGDDLFDLCSRFPHNSKCKGYTAPVSLEDRSGDDAQCLLGDEEETESCKVDLEPETLVLYVETGDDLDILDGDKDTKELTIPLSAIESFSYSEDSEIDTGKVLSFGVIGLLDKDEIATLDFVLKPELEIENAQILDRLLLVTDRDAGETMLEEIESKTQLSAEILDEEE